MSTLKCSLFVFACALLCAPQAAAQSLQQDSKKARNGSQAITVIIEHQQLRFTGPAIAQQTRLEAFNQAGELVYDSGFVSGSEISWALHNSLGAAIPSGLYAYTLTVKEANSETPTMRRGHLIIERGRDRDPQTDRLWVTNQGAIGADESLTGAELAVSSGPESSVAGARIDRSSVARSTLNFDIFGTPGRIPMFAGSDLLADSVINQDFNNRIGIGTATPGTALLTVAGQIHTTSGGIKFPNGTVQTTSAAGALFQVFHDATLSGSGTELSPLRVAIPLVLSGNAPDGVIKVTNTSTGGTALSAIGGEGSARTGGGSGLDSIGGDSFNMTPGGDGIRGFGGSSNSGFGGRGGVFIGGVTVSNGGDGLVTQGGEGFFAGNRGGRGIRAISGKGIGGATAGLAGEFIGDVAVLGNLSKGGGSFKIDHPLDPANKYLSHSFVESPDMMNVYNGNITTDGNGEATVTLPDYFEALNRDFRYQLTVIGQFAQAIVASKIIDNRFTIKTDRPGVEVSWQVTGIRQDAYANKHRIQVEEEKTERERGYYLHPEIFNQPEEKSLEWARPPNMMLEIKSQRANPPRLSRHSHTSSLYRLVR
ncbi:MAG TPA: hypothetical protein VJ810_15440 [Blastocatellia bacterium]|nr:hypothetical protein [Blastocatellia bacterium]